MKQTYILKRFSCHKKILKPVKCKVIFFSSENTRSPKGNDSSPENQQVKSLNKRKVVWGFTINRHGHHLGHVTLNFYIYIGSHSLYMLDIKFGQAVSE